MKKIIALIFVFGFSFTANWAFAAELFSIDISRDNNNAEEVIRLQKFLGSEGLYLNNQNGIFSIEVLESVKKFQNREGIPATGYFGPISRKRANELVMKYDISKENIVSRADQTLALRQQIESLTKLVLALQEQLVKLQASNTNLEKAVAQTNTNYKPTSYSYFVAEITSDKELIKNDGVDFATVKIVTKLSNGEILPNKKLRLKEYGPSPWSGIIKEEDIESDNNGIIIYKTTPSSTKGDGCGNLGSAGIVIFDGEKEFSKRVSFYSDQPVKNDQWACSRV